MLGVGEPVRIGSTVPGMEWWVYAGQRFAVRDAGDSATVHIPLEMGNGQTLGSAGWTGSLSNPLAQVPKVDGALPADVVTERLIELVGFT